MVKSLSSYTPNDRVEMTVLQRRAICCQMVDIIPTNPYPGSQPPITRHQPPINPRTALRIHKSNHQL